MSKRDWRLLALFAVSLTATEITSAFIGKAAWILPAAVSMLIFTMTLMAFWTNGREP